ncbi:MAG: TonB-dependent receptor [Bacteroidetes bacterium]|nr:TonB-dependent receptor [Bacteroidota bacterium]
MIKKALLLFFIVLSAASVSQTIKLSGNIKDTTAGGLKLPNVLLMAIKFKDSTLVNFSHSDKDGKFAPIKVPVDTYIVILSHPQFSDKTYLLVPNKNDSVFNFRNISMPPKSIELNEVEVIAYKDKMYYKGDTLQFTADSFKLKQNANVEDLLKKLPGAKVDAAGKITIQGKVVDQVLVDGDEFFGTDPTIATKNLNANTVETVQVYEKKNENTEGGGDETVKIVNLKLKEDSKKGYFGKISGATDAQKFYENDLLINKFKKNRKVSLFGLFANTPKQAFGWNDANQYGLGNENGGNYDPETNTWTSFNNNSTGVPQTLKTGFYFNDKFGKSTKINSDYTFKQNQLVAGSETNTQFFLTDTSYSNSQIIHNNTNNQAHSFNFRITQNLDSLTELTVRPKINYTAASNNNSKNDDFISQNNILTRQTNILNTGSSEITDASLQLKLNRNFMKKDRSLSLNYQPSYYNSSSLNNLNTSFKYFQGQATDSSILQKRTTDNLKTEQNATITYIEPWTKKIKTEIGYGVSHNQNNSNRKTLDFSGQGYDLVNPTQSNDFRNVRISQRIGTKFIYDVKKYRVSLGVTYRNIYQQNINVSKTQTLSSTFNNVLPFANVNFRINQGSNLMINYNTSAQQPDLQQLQPVIDNTDPNRIKTGNPALRPQFSNNFSLNYYFYKGISDVNFYSGSQFNLVSNEINEKTTFDNYGRSLTTPVNVNGNYFGNIWLGGGFPILKRWMKIMYNFSGSINKNISFVNDQKNTTQVLSVNPGLTLEKELDYLEVNIGGNYSYNQPKQTISLSSNQPYYTYGFTGRITTKLPKKIRISTDGDYTNNGNRAAGYNINYFILNAQISKTFFKRENLIISIEGNDILNQNISNQRIVEANKIVDTKTQVIKRYFLLRAVFKFNSNKEKKEEGDDD